MLSTLLKVKKNLSLYRLILVLILFSFTTIVHAQKVVSDHDRTTDFSKYKTYAWIAPGDSVLNRYRNEKVYGGFITYVANRELKNRGMRIDTLKPDAIFVFDTEVQSVTQYKQGAVLSVGVAVAGPGYYAGGSAPVAGGKITSSTSEDGMIRYAMYDAQTRQLIWSAHAEKTFKMADDIQKIIEDGTKKIFKRLPSAKSK